MDGPATTGRPAGERSPGMGFAAVEVLALGAAAVAFVASLGWDKWSLGSLAAITVLAVVSELMSFQAEGGTLRVSGTLLGIVLASVLLGGGPGAVVGLATCGMGWFRRRESAATLLNNLVTYAWFPLACGIFFHIATHAVGAGQHAIAYYFL